jgi:hypothetical protein
MRLPNFTAELSLNTGINSYHDRLLSLAESTEHVIPAAPYWGDFKREECIGKVRKYSSILWGSSDWEKDCYNTVAYITNADGVRGAYNTVRCDKQIFNMWGIFYVPESSCRGGGGESCYCNPRAYKTASDCHRAGGAWCCEDPRTGIGTCSQA